MCSAMDERLNRISDVLPVLITTLAGWWRWEDLAELWIEVGGALTPAEWLANDAACAELCKRAQALTPALDLTAERLHLGLCIAAMQGPAHSSANMNECIPLDLNVCRLLAQHTPPCAPVVCLMRTPSEWRSRCLPQTLVALLRPSAGEDFDSTLVVQSLLACLLKHGCTRLGSVEDPMPLSEQEGDSPAADADDIPSIADAMAGILQHEFNIDVATDDLVVAANFVYFGRLQQEAAAAAGSETAGAPGENNPGLSLVLSAIGEARATGSECEPATSGSADPPDTVHSLTDQPDTEYSLTEPDYSLTIDPRSGQPIKPGTKRVRELNAKLSTGKARHAAEFMHPNDYDRVYGDGASGGGGTSGGGTSGGGVCGAWEEAGGLAGEKKKPR